MEKDIIIEEYTKEAYKKRVNSYRKGCSFERRIVKDINQKLKDFNVKVMRTPLSGAFATVYRLKTIQGDVFSEDFFPFYIEIKFHKQISFLDFNKSKIKKWLINIEKRNTENFLPLLIFKANFSPIFVAFPLKWREINLSRFIFEEDILVFYSKKLTNKYLITYWEKLDLKGIYKFILTNFDKKEEKNEKKN